MAKDDDSLRNLQQQFKERTVDKRYLALVDGHLQPLTGLIDADIGRNQEDWRYMAVLPPDGEITGRPSQTRYAVAAYYEAHSLVTCYPRTGRTHQIRVHLAHLNHPIVGDYLYGQADSPYLPQRHFLHAAALSFAHPYTGETMSLSCPMPAELHAVLAQLPRHR